MRRIGVIGAGAFGTALACAQAGAGREVVLWGRDAASMAAMARGGMNSARLPGVALPEGLTPSAALVDLAGVEAVLLALPAQVTGTFLEASADHLPDAPLVLCAKGLRRADHKRQSEIAAEAAPERRVAVLTGPGFAAEIARGLPTALTLACADAGLGRHLQERLATPRLRLYFTDDVLGAELGGALKNVIALACGMIDGRGLGQSARAALMTRGYAEIARLAAALGGRAETLAGLSGLGDLSLTCNSLLSRNFSAGRAIGQGTAPPGVTTEGIATARAACELGRRAGVEMPISAAVAAVLDGSLSLDAAIDGLLGRPLREE